MTDPAFHEYVRRQWPLRPSHPDFERLVEVVDLVESLKQNSVEAKAAYDRFVDAISVAYIGANRMAMNIPDDFPRGLRDHIRREVHLMMTNAWVEGVFFGVYFQSLGGHREDPETPDSGSSP